MAFTFEFKSVWRDFNIINKQMEIKQNNRQAQPMQGENKQDLKTEKTTCVKVEETEQSIKTKNRTGRWRKRQQAKYILFMRRHYYIMRCPKLKYHYKIFTKMAEVIGTRDAVQCKSHHQKILKKYSKIQHLIFSQNIVSGPIYIGQGVTGNHYQSVMNGLENILTNAKQPNLVIQTVGRIIVLLDSRYINNY